MSDFDEELDDDFNEGPSSDDVTDDFEDPQQSTAALTKEINKLRQKNEGLRQYNVRQKDRYKDEVRSFLSPLIQKYKDIQNENDFLKRQIKEISQNTAGLKFAKQNGENGSNGEHHDNPLKIMENTIEEKEREISVLNKMVRNLEEETNSIKRDMAEVPQLKDSIKLKNEKISKIEEEKFDLSSKIEAKDSMLSKYLNQINELETNTYVLQKRLSERVGQIENGRISEYEDKLDKAHKQIAQLNEKIDHLEKQLSDYQDTMNSLEEELDEDNFMQHSALATSSSMLSSIDLDKQDEEEIEVNELIDEIEDDEEELLIDEVPSYDYTQLYDDKNSDEIDDLPSDDELLAHDIELEDMNDESGESYDDSEISLDELAEDEVSLDHSYDNDQVSLDEDLVVDDDEVSLDHSYDDDEVSLDDLPVDDDILNDFDDMEISLDDIDTLDDVDLDLEDDLDLNLDDEEDDALNPLSQFETSDDVLDEDRDTSNLLKKEAK